jgi:hypothetical protein
MRIESIKIRKSCLFQKKVENEHLDCIQTYHESSFRGEDDSNLKNRKFIHEKFTEEIEKC